MYTVEEFFEDHKNALELSLVGSTEGLAREISVPEAHRPGLSLAGHRKYYTPERILVFGRLEVEFMRELSEEVCRERLRSMLYDATPAVIFARDYTPCEAMQSICKEQKLPIFCSPLPTAALLGRLTFILSAAFAPTTTRHGTLVEVFGIGVLIEGESSVGKSEAALGLIERGQRLISDDIVKVRRLESGELFGEGVELTRHHMEIRGIGIINVASLYGAVCVRERKRIDIVVRLEEWDDDHFYDRVGLNDETCDILGAKVPFHVLPVKPGRDVVLLLETIALNHRLKQRGVNAAKELGEKLLAKLSRSSASETGSDDSEPSGSACQTGLDDCSKAQCDRE